MTAAICAGMNAFKRRNAPLRKNGIGRTPLSGSSGKHSPSYRNAPESLPKAAAAALRRQSRGGHGEPSLLAIVRWLREPPKMVRAKIRAAGELVKQVL
jgi:hypothetical protein